MTMRTTGAALALAPLAMIAAQPVVAASPGTVAPGGLWLPVCSGGDTHWRFRPSRPGAPGRQDRDTPPTGLCVHMMGARDTKGLLNRPRRT